MICIKNISKSYKSHTVLDDINLSINDGEFVVIIGESGCGKTTLLKLLNRLVKPTSGDIFINDKNIKDTDEVLLRRNMGYVIQQTGLFPHMTIKENLELVPKLQKKNDIKTIEEKTKEVMHTVGLNSDEYLNRYPSELSGGQQQRVGVARAFAIDPDIILMDEPFSALDPITRCELQDEIVRLQVKFKKTIVFVTHDMDEAVKIADKICIMKDGKVLQYDTPENILKNPVDDFVENFVGKNRIWDSPEYIKINDIMVENPVITYEDMSVLKCMDKMRQNKVDSLIVVDDRNKKLIGVVNASDLRLTKDRVQSVKDYVIRDYPTLLIEQNILDALKIVTSEHLSTVPVIDRNGDLRGLITRSSLVTTLSQQYFDFDEEEQS